VAVAVADKIHPLHLHGLRHLGEVVESIFSIVLFFWWRVYDFLARMFADRTRK